MALHRLFQTIVLGAGLFALVIGSAVARDQMAPVMVYASGIREADGLAFDSEGNLFVAGETWLGVVYRVDRNGRVSVVARGIPSADGLVIAKDDTIYVTSEVMNGRVAVLGKERRAPDLAQLRNPEGIAFDADGVLYVVEDLADGRVVRIREGRIESVVEGLRQPENIAFDGLGNLYITETGTGHILRVDPAGHQELLTDKIEHPDGIVYSEHFGGLFVTQDKPREARIYFVDPNGAITPVADGLYEPQGIVVDRDGDLYVAEQGKHRIIRIPARAIGSGLTARS